MQSFSLQISKVKIWTNEHSKVDLTFIDEFLKNNSKIFSTHLILEAIKNWWFFLKTIISLFFVI
jgi:hypothetical protein